MPEFPQFSAVHQLAPAFLERQKLILARWRERVDANPLIENSPRLSRSQFYDHIPDILQAFARRLQRYSDDAEQQPGDREDERESEMAHQHSRHRWQQGYSLKSLLHEWGDLNLVVLGALDELALEDGGGDVAVFSRARLEWAEMLGTNLSEGAEAYNDLLQAEAQSRVRELEEAFECAREFEINRGELLRQTSHDLRGNLSKVVHATELLQIGKISSDERSQVTEILRGGVRSLSQMLSDLLAVSRLEAGKESVEIAPFDAAVLLREMADSSRAVAIDKQLWLKSSGPGELLVWGDAAKIARIAQNLLLNALAYTERGGVTISWERRDERQWSLEVRDTGPGLQSGPLAARMKQATQEARAVESEAEPNNVAPRDEQSSHSSSHGEGIGLSIVRRLCELLDATLELDSIKDSGTSFRVVLPTRYANA